MYLAATDSIMPSDAAPTERWIPRSREACAVLCLAFLAIATTGAGRAGVSVHGAVVDSVNVHGAFDSVNVHGAVDCVNRSGDSPEMRLAAARQVAVLAPAFAAHTAWISPFSLRIGPYLDVHLEDAVGAAAMLWLAPRCRQAFSASLPGSSLEQLLRPRELLAVVVALLLRYLLAGYLGNALEQLFAAAAPAQPSARVAAQALGHLAWHATALQLLGQRLAFFSADAGWISMQCDGPWLRWVLAGFAASATAYFVAAETSQLFLFPPATGLAAASAAESVIAPMVRSECGPLRAVGYFSSCVSGPVVEEIVHRGFLLTALRRLLPVGMALPASAALFALQHGPSAPLLPLGALGLLWSLLYLGSGNLLVSVLTHALWNLRVLLLSK